MDLRLVRDARFRRYLRAEVNEHTRTADQGVWTTTLLRIAKRRHIWYKNPLFFRSSSRSLRQMSADDCDSNVYLSFDIFDACVALLDGFLVELQRLPPVADTSHTTSRVHHISMTCLRELENVNAYVAWRFMGIIDIYLMHNSSNINVVMLSELVNELCDKLYAC